MKPTEVAVSLVVFAVAVLVLVYLFFSENTRRMETSSTLSRMEAFMATGARFPQQYGLGHCERIRIIEIKLSLPDPIDCDAIRHALAISSTPALQALHNPAKPKQ